MCDLDPTYLARFKFLSIYTELLELIERAVCIPSCF